MSLPSLNRNYPRPRTEVNDIFKDIANIVQEQGDMLDSIEGNLTQTYDRVDRGTTELTHASRYQVRRPRHGEGVAQRRAEKGLRPVAPRCAPLRLPPPLTASPSPTTEKSAQQGHVPPRHCRHRRRYPCCRLGDLIEEEEVGATGKERTASAPCPLSAPTPQSSYRRPCRCCSCLLHVILCRGI